MDENTPLADHQSFSDYSATATEYSITAKQDVEVGEKATPIDRVFISIALLGTAAQPSLDRLSRVLPLTRNLPIGIFLAAADDSFVIATHGEIATDFKQVALGPWIVSAYNLGFIATLPLVCKPRAKAIPG